MTNIYTDWSQCLTGGWPSFSDGQHVQGEPGVYYGKDHAEEIRVWPKFYWPSFNYGTFPSNSKCRQNGESLY